MNERSLVRVGACEFVMRLLARVTGEKREAMYVWHRCWLVSCLKKKIERRKFPGSYSEIKQNSGGPGKKKFMRLFPKIWGLVVFSSRPDFGASHWIPHEQLGSKWL
jgi:hypothetical protein